MELAGCGSPVEVEYGAPIEWGWLPPMMASWSWIKWGAGEEAVADLAKKNGSPPLSRFLFTSFFIFPAQNGLLSFFAPFLFCVALLPCFSLMSNGI